MTLLALDPAPVETAWVMWDGERIIDKGKNPNSAVLDIVNPNIADKLAIEMIASYGMSVGREVFETCVWIGRFMQAWEDTETVVLASPPIRISRLKVKSHLCHSGRATDSNVRQALIDRIGPQGIKNAPGPTFGCSKDIWAALAVAVTVFDKLQIREKLDW